GFGPGLRDVPEREEIFAGVHPYLRAAEPERRTNAVLALGWLADERALPDLAPFLGDAASAMRHWAAVSIGRYRTPEANRVLLDRLREADERDRTTIVTILGKTDDPEIVEPLIELLETAKSGGSRLPSAIFDAICRFDRKDVRRTLESCADDFFCPGQDHAIRRLKDLREGRAAGAWT
ncbi:MAG: HEAT repeat domain-containing protein, partial [Planctomycetota bacterium]